MKILVNNFRGEIPIISDHLLPELNASSAVDCRLRNGGIDPLREVSTVTSINYSNVFISGASTVLTSTGSIHGYAGTCNPELGTLFFNVVEWTGDNSVTTITGVDFKPDFVWAKDVGREDNWTMIDSSRGRTKVLICNKEYDEITENNALMSFDDDGFTVGIDDRINKNSQSYQAYCFKKQPGFFDIQIFDKLDSRWGGPEGYTGSHDLGVEPEVMILKNRISSNNPEYPPGFGGSRYGKVYYAGAGKDRFKILTLANWFIDDFNYPAFGNDYEVWKNTAPTATEFTVGRNFNNYPDPYVIWLFASMAGVSEIGDYTGTGSTITLNFDFTPMCIMITSITEERSSKFNVFDKIQSPSNPAQLSLAWDTDNEQNDWGSGILNFLNSSIEIITTNNNFNETGKDYLYMAFGEPEQPVGAGCP